jgi:CCR4-NOT transcription complex subunit 2
MPPRSVNVLQGGGYVPGLQPSNHRTSSQTQSMLPQQPTPGFMQQRGSSFPFGAGLGQAAGQHQPSSTLQQPHSANSQSSQANGTSTPLPPHLTQNTTTPSLGGTAPSVSSASEVGLDPNDFPALGSTPANTNNTTSNGNATTTSYASQAGTALAVATGSGSSGPAVGASGTSGNSSQPRDFTPDDFPALGGQPQSQSQTQNQSSQDSSHPHPPGLNGFQHNDHSQHRPNLLGSLGGGLQTPGMLNLGPTQTRNVHPGFQQSQSEAEKQQQRVSTFYELGFSL